MAISGDLSPSIMSDWPGKGVERRASHGYSSGRCLSRRLATEGVKARVWDAERPLHRLALPPEVRIPPEEIFLDRCCRMSLVEVSDQET